jgi:pimeloyl-ACP methyl ester carboxylesterase
MKQVISQDGTPIAYDQVGKGPAVIVVGGVLGDRSQQAPLAALLSEHFTVFNYDRRGHGESGDKAPYAVEREIEDLGAVIDAAGGSAFVYRTSGCAVLALSAAARGLAPRIKKLALWEPPFVVDDSRPPVPRDYEALAHTLIYDATLMGDFSLPKERVASITVPTLVIDGGQAPWMSHAAQTVADVLPHAQRRTLAGQPHNVDPAAMAPVLVEFFIA